MTVAPQDAEIYGEELVRDARRWAREELGGQIQHLNHRLDQQALETNRSRVIAALDRDPGLAASWRSVNNDPEFLRWLNDVDELNGEARMRLLIRAFDLGASDRVAHIFKAFQATRLPQRQRTEQRLPFEGASRTSVHADTADNRVWTRAAIRQFYHDRAKGKYDGREPEAMRIEADIIAAARQGRVAADAVQPRMKDQRF